MPTLTPPLHSIPATIALGLDFAEAVESDELEPVIYLLDQAGGGFGYRYEWEQLGPFSSELVRDLSHLSDRDVEDGRNLTEDELDDDLRKAIERVSPLIEPPGGLGLSRPAWLYLPP